MNKNGMNLIEMAQEILRRQDQKRDFIVPTADLKLQDSGALEIGDQGDYPLTEHAHGQLATWAEIPRKYYEKMRAEAPGLLARNVNHWLRDHPVNRMVRTLDGAARAFLSDRYQRIDNEQIAEAVLPVLMENCGHAAILSCCVTDAKLYIQALFPRLEGEVTVGDAVQGGVIISNGEIGNGALDLRPLVYRLVCTNGLIVGKTAEDARLRRNHIGRRIEATEDYSLYSDETLAADDRALALKIRDTVRALANPALFERILREMRAAADQPPIGNPIAAVTALGKSYTLPQQERDSVLMNLIRNADYTQWGLVNAITAAANDHASYDRAVELQHLGGQVLDLKPVEWRRIAAAQPAERDLADA